MDYDKFVNIVIGSEQYSLFISCNDSSFSIMLNEQHDEKISNFKHQSHYSLEQLISLNSILLHRPTRQVHITHFSFRLTELLSSIPMPTVSTASASRL